jgi:hypothetical protein
MSIQEINDEDDIHEKDDHYRHIAETIPSAAWYIIVTEFWYDLAVVLYFMLLRIPSKIICIHLCFLLYLI